MGYEDTDRELQYSQKYRPSTFMEYIGNQRVKERVHAALNSKAKPQVMLFSGASGCGKTTIARLIAKEYLCEDENKGVTGACGVCPACQAVDEYIHTGKLDNLGEYYENLKEIDVADQSGKSAIDSVLMDAEIPAYSGWKIYIFDECHRASPQAQTRMLKIAEEPPENVLFIFCTTNPEEMLDTLVNRCQLKLEIKKPTVKELTGLLVRVCREENKDYDIKGLSVISGRSNLTIRDALHNLQSVITERGSAKYDDVLAVFEEVSDKILFRFFNFLVNKDVMGYITLFYEIKTKMDLKSFMVSLTDFVVRGIYILNGIDIDGLTDSELDSYRKLFSKFTVEQIGTLLAKLNEIKGTDIETKLLLLVYLGLSGTPDTEKQENLVPTIEGEVNKEAGANTKNTQERSTPTQEQMQQAIDTYSQGVSFSDMLKGLQGTSMLRK